MIRSWTFVEKKKREKEKKENKNKSIKFFLKTSTYHQEAQNLR